MMCKNNTEHQEHAVPETFRIDMSLLLGRVVFVPNRGANIVAAWIHHQTKLQCAHRPVQCICPRHAAQDTSAV